jgi:hypothetical protein
MVSADDHVWSIHRPLEAGGACGRSKHDCAQFEVGRGWWPGPQVAFASEALAAATFEVGAHVTALWSGDKNTEPGEYHATILELHALVSG